MHRFTVSYIATLVGAVVVTGCSSASTMDDAGVATDMGVRTPCRTESDCDAPLHCHLRVGACSECAYDADCAEGSSCEDGTCVLHLPCGNSLACAVGEVCDPTALRCYECARDQDCEGAQACRNNRCVQRCQSDTQCTANGLLCDGVVCVACTQTIDCPADYFCDAAECRRDVCESGRRWCVDDQTIAQCAFDGSEQVNTTCQSGSSCRGEGAGITCEPWTCVPGETYCDASEMLVETCDDDGFGRTLSETCDPSERCHDGACIPATCEPNQLGCSENEYYLERCNSLGTAWVRQQSCYGLGRFCLVPVGVLGVDPSCVPRRCTPNTDACSTGDTLSRCNDAGSGFDSVTEDCSAMGLYCSDASCGTTGTEWIAREAATRHSPYWSTSTWSTFFVPDVARTLTSVSTRVGDASDVGDSVHAESVIRVFALASGASDATLVTTVPFASLVVDGESFLTSAAMNVALTPGTTYEIAVTLRSGTASPAAWSYRPATDTISIGTVTGASAYQGHPTTMSEPNIGSTTRFSLRFSHTAP